MVFTDSCAEMFYLMVLPIDDREVQNKKTNTLLLRDKKMKSNKEERNALL